MYINLFNQLIDKRILNQIQTQTRVIKTYQSTLFTVYFRKTLKIVIYLVSIKDEAQHIKIHMLIMNNSSVLIFVKMTFHD